MEIAVYRALVMGPLYASFGGFTDLDQHDDSSPYRKEEPPTAMSGRGLSRSRVDFIAFPNNIPVAIEVKNIREWIYPDRQEVRDLLHKAIEMHAVPVLIARRIHFSTFSILGRCGVLMHENYGQIYAKADESLADQARHKRNLGFHDIRVGNNPDARLIKFLNEDMPRLVQAASVKVDMFRDLLWSYGKGEMGYTEFARKVIRRDRGEPESDEEEIDPNDLM